MVQTLDEVFREDEDLSLRDSLVLLDEGGEVATGSVLVDRPEMVLRLVPIVEAKDVEMLQRLVDLHFVHQLQTVTNKYKQRNQRVSLCADRHSTFARPLFSIDFTE